ncbi:MAG: chemotaxis protein CheB, partial [Lentisphaeraceae bacterium]|nr:chemotaxis protein CheB [Lentisphaeraceae bacterium]
GARGMTVIKKLGGLTLAQDPETAEVPTMPQASIEATDIDHIASLQGISCLLKKLCREESSNA